MGGQLSAKHRLLATTIAIVLCGCSIEESPFQVMCGPIKSLSRRGFSASSYETESMHIYKWKPVIRVDRKRGTLLWANSFDNGKSAAYPRIIKFTENSGVLAFDLPLVGQIHKSFLDTSKMTLSFSRNGSDGSFWDESHANGKCISLKRMPDLIYEK